jgi:hypothetical protein
MAMDVSSVKGDISASEGDGAIHLILQGKGGGRYHRQRGFHERQDEPIPKS